MRPELRTSAVPPSDRWVEADGLRLHCLDWGGPSNRTVLFLHGGGLTAHTWDLACLALRREYRCLALDLRGHGESDWANSGDYRLTDFATDIAATVEQTGSNPPLIVGHSLGGQAALLAVGGGTPASGLALIDVGPSPAEDDALRILRSLGRAQEFADLDFVVAAASMLNPRRETAVLRKTLTHNLRKLPSGRLTWKYDWRAFTSVSHAVLARRALAAWDAIGSVQVPVLLIRGADSSMVDDFQTAALGARLEDFEERVVKHAGHTVHGDNPDGFLDALTPFLVRCFS